MPNDFDNDMTSLRATVLGDVFGPSNLGQRPTTLTIITRTFLGPYAGTDVPTQPDVPLAIPGYVKIRHVSQREIASSGGAYEDGDVVCSDIPVSFTDPVTGRPGGFTEAQLKPPGAMGNSQTDQAVEIIYRLAQTDSSRGGIAGDYAIVELARDNAWSFKLVLRRTMATP